MAENDRAQALEDDYEDLLEVQGQGSQGQGQQGEDGEENGAGDAALDTGEEQEAGQLQDLRPQPSRGEVRFQRLANENAELKRRLDAIERQGRSEQPRQQWPQEESDEQFNARTQLLPLEDRLIERQVRSDRRNAQAMQFMMFQSQEAADKAAFEAKCLTSASRRRLAAAVEDEQQKLLRDRGQWSSREVVFNLIRGRLMTEREDSGEKPVRRQRQQGEQRIQQQTARPSQGGSDVQRGGRQRLTEREARAKRLEGQQI